MPVILQRAAVPLLLSIAAACFAAAPAASLPRAAPVAENGPLQLAQAKRPAKRAIKRGKKAKQKAAADDDSKETRIWRYTRDSAGPLLSFGARKGDELIVAFSCVPGSGQIRVVAYTASKNTRRGDTARLRLMSGKSRLEIAGTAFADTRRNRVDIGGITRGGGQFLEVFRGGETMIVEVPGRKTGVSLKTLGKKADQFAAACAAKS